MSGHVVSIRAYLLIYAALLILLLATVGADLVNLGTGNTVVALLIAALKAVLVAAFFMHLKFSNRLTWVVACAGVFWLSIMITLSLSDYLTRG